MSMETTVESQESAVTDVKVAIVPPPSLDLERLSMLRQQYVDRFFAKNQSLSMFSSVFNKTSAIRNRCVNPVTITHPLFRSSLDGNVVSAESLIPTIVARSMCESLCLEKSRAVLDLTRPGILAINSMALDSHSALLATGSEGGVLSVYDVDEAMFSMQLRHRALIPTIVIDTRKSISSITWNPLKGHEDEVLLTFSFSCDAWLYNLSLAPSDEGYLTVLSPKLFRNGGGKCALFWDSGLRNPRLVTAGSNGIVRCWQLKYNSKKCVTSSSLLWNMRVGLPQTEDIPVVFLYRLPETSHLLAINALGAVSVWDMDRVEAVAFSSTGGEPALVTSFDFFPLLLPYLTTTAAVVGHHPQWSDYDAYIQRVLPVSDGGVGPEHRFTVLLRCGLLCTIDVSNRRLVDVLPRYAQNAYFHGNGGVGHGHGIVPNVLGGRTNEAMTLHVDALAAAAAATAATAAVQSHPPTTSSSVEAAAVSRATAGAFGHNSGSNDFSSVTDLVEIPIKVGESLLLLVQPQHPRGRKDANGLPAPPTTLLRFLNWHHHRQGYLHRYQHRAMLTGVSSGLLKPNLTTGVVESALLKSDAFTYTLPGQVVRAIPGEKEIIVSCDIQHYVGNAVVANSSLSRSSDLRLEWLKTPFKKSNRISKKEERCKRNDAVEVDNEKEEEEFEAKEDNEEGDNVEEEEAAMGGLTQLFSHACQASDYLSQDTTVSSVRPCAVVLNEAYRGPEVEDGYPRVQLRTKLLAQHFRSSSSVSSSSSSSTSSSSSSSTSLLTTSIFDRHVTHYTEEDEHRAYVELHETVLSHYPASSGVETVTPAITCTLAHRVHPIVFLGLKDGRIQLWTPRRDATYLAAGETPAECGPSTTTSVTTGTTSGTAVANVYDTAMQQALRQADPTIRRQFQQAANNSGILLVDTAASSSGASSASTVVGGRSSNMWQASGDLSQSHSRTRTQILEARPAMYNNNNYNNPNRRNIHPTTGIATNIRVNPSATSSNSNGSHMTGDSTDGLDDDLHLIQTIFQKNAASSSSSTSLAPSVSTSHGASSNSKNNSSSRSLQSMLSSKPQLATASGGGTKLAHQTTESPVNAAVRANSSTTNTTNTTTITSSSVGQKRKVDELLYIPQPSSSTTTAVSNGVSSSHSNQWSDRTGEHNTAMNGKNPFVQKIRTGGGGGGSSLNTTTSQQTSQQQPQRPLHPPTISTVPSTQVQKCLKGLSNVHPPSRPSTTGSKTTTTMANCRTGVYGSKENARPSAVLGLSKNMSSSSKNSNNSNSNPVTFGIQSSSSQRGAMTLPGTQPKLQFGFLSKPKP